jgi:hypothetical protein
MVTTIIILSVLVIILSYTSYNLLKKNEKCEDIIKSYENYMINLSNTIDFSDKKIKEVDRKGSFESDDEVGFFFQQLKYLQEQLNNFKVNIK